jgi:3-hydroxyisobutyrate dehydrogenase-like beta-hydroxyacid dehydrogenase
MVDIAVVGAGRIGLRVARRLVTAGHSVRVHDIRGELERTVRAMGATWGSPSPTADVLLTALPGSPELQSVMLTEAGLLGRLRPGTAWLDLTSASPALGAQLAAAAQDHGIEYLETPVGGGPEAAEAGELTLYVGGERTTFDRHEPMLRTFAKRLHYTGPHGSGYLTKLLVNLLWFNQAIAVGEALLLAQSAGLDPSQLRQTLLTGPASSTFLDAVVPDLLAGDRMPHFGLDRIVEELESLRDLAHDNHIPVPMTDVVTAVHRDALARFGSVDGELLAVSHLEELSGHRLGHCHE